MNNNHLNNKRNTTNTTNQDVDHDNSSFSSSTIHRNDNSIKPKTLNCSPKQKKKQG